MPKSVSTYWNVLAPEHRSRWSPVKGLEGAAEELTLAEDQETGHYTRLTRFLAGADTTTFGPKIHDYSEEVYVIAGELYDAAFDRILCAGDYASRPPGEKHGPFRSKDGCIVLEMAYPNRDR
jgi:quercetin dioxygenase-like cupin family protein